ncbi:DUF6318 family protein [Cellulomonas chitinilytica]|nr:DUF6318 family protein [Cellulomonas chitinilytica]
MLRIVTAIRLPRTSAALVVGFLLAGCTNAPASDPSIAPTGAASSTPTSVPTPTASADADADAAIPPDRPTALDGPATVENAETVAVYFQRLYPYVYATGDISEWKTLTDPDCIFCHSVLSEVAQLEQVGQRMRGGLITASDVTALEPDPGHVFHVTFHVEVEPTELLDTTGAVIQSNPASVGTIDTIVIWEDGTWVVRGVTPTQAS